MNIFGDDVGCERLPPDHPAIQKAANFFRPVLQQFAKGKVTRQALNDLRDAELDRQGIRSTSGKPAASTTIMKRPAAAAEVPERKETIATAKAASAPRISKGPAPSSSASSSGPRGSMPMPPMPPAISAADAMYTFFNT